MGTVTRNSVGVVVNVMEKSVTYMVNTLFQVMFRVANGRGLPPDYITGRKDVIERGLFTWISEQSLNSFHLEVASPDGSCALERWDVTLDYSYSADPDAGVRKPPIEELAEVCKTLRSLPPGATYRILVRTKPFASKVRGWETATFRAFNPTTEKEFSCWGFGPVGAKLLYRGAALDQSVTEGKED